MSGKVVVDCLIYESNGYWDFWQKQSQIPGQDCETVCGLLDSIKGKLDDIGGTDANGGSGQIMAYINEPTGRICSWGIPLAECFIFIMTPNDSGNMSGRLKGCKKKQETFL